MNIFFFLSCYPVQFWKRLLWLDKHSGQAWMDIWKENSRRTDFRRKTWSSWGFEWSQKWSFLDCWKSWRLPRRFFSWHPVCLFQEQRTSSWMFLVLVLLFCKLLPSHCYKFRSEMCWKFIVFLDCYIFDLTYLYLIAK